MASVPGGDASPTAVRDFYTGSTGVIVAAQLLGLLAAACLAVSARALSSLAPAARAAAVRWSGYAVSAAAVLTAVPVLWLCAVAAGAPDGRLHSLAELSDLTDVLLFAAVAVFAVCVARRAARRWLQVTGWLVALVTAARAVLLLVGSSRLGLVAPMAFILLVLVLSVTNLARPGAPLLRPAS